MTGKKKKSEMAEYLASGKLGSLEESKTEALEWICRNRPQNLKAKLAKLGEAAFDDSRTMLPLLPSVPAEWGPCTPPASAHNPLSSMCIWLAELSQMTASQRQRKLRNVGVSHSILGRQIHTMGNHHDARVSKDLASREEPEEFRFYRAPVLGSLCQSAPGSVSLASR